MQAKLADPQVMLKTATIELMCIFVAKLVLLSVIKSPQFDKFANFS